MFDNGAVAGVPLFSFDIELKGNINDGWSLYMDLSLYSCFAAVG